MVIVAGPAPELAEEVIVQTDDVVMDRASLVVRREGLFTVRESRKLAPQDLAGMLLGRVGGAELWDERCLRHTQRRWLLVVSSLSRWFIFAIAFCSCAERKGFYAMLSLQAIRSAYPLVITTWA
jgi:hypothetical protein